MTAFMTPATVENRTVEFPRPRGALAISAEPLPPLERLAVLWRDLESRADGSFFTSWSWIGAWLAAGVGQPCVLVSARVGAEIVGLAILTQARGGPWPRTVLALNQQSGSGGFYIEYNDILVDRVWGSLARRAILDSLADGSAMACDDLEIAGATPEMAGAVAATDLVLDSEERACAWVDFAACGGTPDGHLAALSRNTRGQIRRAQRLAAGAAGLTVHRAQTYAEKVSALNELRRLHQASWRSRGQPGAFADPRFSAFVSALLFMPGVELLHVGAGARTIGVLLNFVHRGHVYAYQSGLAYEDDNRFKPGLVCHAAAIAESLRLGRKGYHFMAGAARYKDSLGTARETLVWLTASRPGAGTTVIRGLRGAKALARSLAGH